MKLYFAPASPFSRKVRIAAAVLGLALELVPTETINPADPIGKKIRSARFPRWKRTTGTAFSTAP